MFCHVALIHPINVTSNEFNQISQIGVTAKNFATRANFFFNAVLFLYRSLFLVYYISSEWSSRFPSRMYCAGKITFIIVHTAQRNRSTQ